MSAVKIAEAQIQTEKAQELARLRKAIRLVAENPGNLLAAEIYLRVSKGEKE